MMEYPIETGNTYFYNGGFETKHTMLIIPAQGLLIASIFIIMVITYFILK